MWFWFVGLRLTDCFPINVYTCGDHGCHGNRFTVWKSCIAGFLNNICLSAPTRGSSSSSCFHLLRPTPAGQSCARCFAHGHRCQGRELRGDGDTSWRLINARRCSSGQPSPDPPCWIWPPPVRCSGWGRADPEPKPGSPHHEVTSCCSLTRRPHRSATESRLFSAAAAENRLSTPVSSWVGFRPVSLPSRMSEDLVWAWLAEEVGGACAAAAAVVEMVRWRAVCCCICGL